jgi:sugar phosphate permease
VDVLGLIYAAFPLGYVVASMIFGCMEKLPHRGFFIQLTLIIAAVLLAMFGLDLPLWALLLAAFFNSMALEVGQLVWLSLLQEKIPNEQLGRVFSIDAVGSFALLPVGFALVGFGTEQYGAQTMFLLEGGLTALTSLTVLAFVPPTLRRLD